MARSKLQKLGKEEVQRRVKIKQNLRFKRNVKSSSNKVILTSSIALNIYLLSRPYHEKILTNINEIYLRVAPIVEALINKLPL